MLSQPMYLVMFKGKSSFNTSSSVTKVKLKELRKGSYGWWVFFVPILLHVDGLITNFLGGISFCESLTLEPNHLLNCFCYIYIHTHIFAIFLHLSFVSLNRWHICMPGMMGKMVEEQNSTNQKQASPTGSNGRSEG